MAKLVINGGNKLCGCVKVHGAKNSALPILCACVLCRGVNVIHNCPRLSDVFATVKILEGLGCRCDFTGNTLTVDSSIICGNNVSKELMCKMRSSVIFLSSITARKRFAMLYNPGGCNLGPRPIDLHIFALQTLGIKVFEINGRIFTKAAGGITGNVINMPKVSVGATQTAMIAAATANGNTIIENAAKEPEIVDLQNFLNTAGANITGAGTSTIRICGVNRLTGATYTVMPDRIVASTLLCGVAACGGRAKIQGANKNHMLPVISVLQKAGCRFTVRNSLLSVFAPEKLIGGQNIVTEGYPGFPTDAGPLIAAALLKANGKSTLTETVFSDRFAYFNGFKQMGANISIDCSKATISGVKSLTGAEVAAADLRGGAALVIAGLSAKGKTVINNPCYIYRGYENIENMFSSLGGNIFRVN